MFLSVRAHVCKIPRKGTKKIRNMQTIGFFLGIQPDDFKRDKKPTHKSNDCLLWLTLVITVKRRQKDGKRKWKKAIINGQPTKYVSCPSAQASSPASDGGVVSMPLISGEPSMSRESKVIRR